MSDADDTFVVGRTEDGRYSLGLRLSGEYTSVLAQAQQRYLNHSTLYDKDASYRDLCNAMARFRPLRWDDEDDEPRLSALEARAFRLMARLRRLNYDIDATESWP